MKAKFWTYINGAPVKIKLREGQVVAHAEGGPTDEGYSRTMSEWYFDGEKVVYEYHVDARDCDGRIERHAVLECPVGGLQSRDVEMDAFKWPAWVEIARGQRDYTAESMGY